MVTSVPNVSPAAALLMEVIAKYAPLANFVRMVADPAAKTALLELEPGPQDDHERMALTRGIQRMTRFLAMRGKRVESRRIAERYILLASPSPSASDWGSLIATRRILDSLSGWPVNLYAIAAERVPGVGLRGMAQRVEVHTEYTPIAEHYLSEVVSLLKLANYMCSVHALVIPRSGSGPAASAFISRIGPWLDEGHSGLRLAA